MRPSLPLQLLPLLLLHSVSASKAAVGAACEYASVHLDSGSYALNTGCVATAYCSSDNVCVAKTCRRDEYPYGYTDPTSFPPRCHEGYACPDEGSGCEAQAGLGEVCQLDRDDECSKPDNWKELASSRNVNGSVCLNQVCHYQNVTIGATCEVENLVFVGYTASGNEFADVRSRDNCKWGGYCDGMNRTCVATRLIGQACSADKECNSNNCNVNGKCTAPANSPVSPHAWVYAIVAVFIILIILGTFATLWYFHKKSREEHQIMLEQYYTEQVAYRESLFNLSHTRDSLFSLNKHAPSDGIKQSLLVPSLEGGGNSPRDSNNL